MNRQPYTEPPRWWSPKSSRFWMGFWTPLRLYQQVRNERIVDIRVEGVELVERAIRRKQGVLITPNHPGHADCYLLWEALNRLPKKCYVMTAWQAFAMYKPIDVYIWRQHGCFSVNREGNDLRAIKFAVRVLSNTSRPLVIFPEGDVYHLNERVTPFRDGVGAIAHSAVRQGERSVACFPCALKYEYVRDPSPELRGVMERLERRYGLPVAAGAPLEKRIHRFLAAALSVRERQYLGRVQEGTLNARFESLADEILNRLETTHQLRRPVLATVPERVKQLRQLLIRQELNAPDTTTRAMLQQEKDDLFFVIQLFSYYGDNRNDYVAERPTVERVAETIDKLEEDFLDAVTAGVRGKRRGIIRFGEPLVIEQSADRDQSRELAHQLQLRVQGLLDELASRRVPVAEVGRSPDGRAPLLGCPETAG